MVSIYPSYTSLSIPSYTLLSLPGFSSNVHTTSYLHPPTSTLLAIHTLLPLPSFPHTHSYLPLSTYTPSYLYLPSHTHSLVSSMEKSDLSDPAPPTTPLPHYQQGHCQTYSFESSGEHLSTAIPSMGTLPHPGKWVFYEECWTLSIVWFLHDVHTCKSDIVDGNCYVCN